MNSSIQKYLFKLRFVKLLEWAIVAAALSIGIFVCLYFFTSLAFYFSIAGFVILLFLGGYKLINLNNYRKASSELNEKVDNLEYSTELLSTPDKKLNSIELIQKKKIQNIIGNASKTIGIENKIPQYLSLLIIALAIAIFLIPFKNFFNSEISTVISQKKATTQINNAENEEDSAPLLPPSINSVNITVTPPDYTNLPSKNLNYGNLEVLENSQINWSLACSKNTDKVKIIKNGSDSFKCYRINNSENTFNYKSNFNKKSFYNFELLSENVIPFTGEIFEIKIIKDETPIIRISQEDVISLEYNNIKNQNFSLQVSDDFGIDKIELFTTVSSGSGESVKFRDSTILVYKEVKNEKILKLNQTINLPNWNLKPGEEFYFHYKVYDNKTPKPNIGRSNNYLISIEDTTKTASFVGSDFPISTMPAYFRSQRQIIIDTEKLIAQKDTIDQDTYEKLSNEIANDQKILRLRYGKFLGEEFESTAGGDSHNHGGHDQDINTGDDTEHDHAEHDHAEHDHAEHDHAEHDHAEHDHAEHDHAKHDHEGRNHAGHDHEGHDHAEHNREEHNHVEHNHSEHDHEGHDHSEHDHEGHDHSEHDHERHDHSEHEGHDHEGHDNKQEEQEHLDHNHGHDHGTNKPTEVDANTTLTDELLEEYMHFHDMREEATYFDLNIQTKLRAALNKMWDSELQLRLGKPKLALPHEKIALKFIKEIQQDSRIYATKVGFDPPKLKPKNRYKGELKDIKNSLENSDLELEINTKKLIQLSKKLAEKNAKSSIVDFEKTKILNDIAAELIEITNKTSLPFYKALSSITNIKNEGYNLKVQEENFRKLTSQLNNIIINLEEPQIQKKTVLAPKLGEIFLRKIQN